MQEKGLLIPSVRDYCSIPQSEHEFIYLQNKFFESFCVYNSELKCLE